MRISFDSMRNIIIKIFSPQTLALVGSVAILSLNGVTLTLLLPVKALVTNFNGFDSDAIEVEAFIPNTEQLVNQFALLSDEHMAKWLASALFQLGYCLGCPIAQFIVASTLNPKSIVLFSMLLTTLCMLGSATALLLWAFLLLQCITGFLAGAAIGSAFGLVLDWSHHTNHVFVSNYLIGARCLSTFSLAVSIKFEQDLARLLFNDEFHTWRRFLLYETIILAVLLCFVFISTKPSPRWVLECDINMEKYNRLAKDFFNALNSDKSKVLDNDLTEELSNIGFTNFGSDIEPISCTLKMNRLLIFYGAVFYALNAGASFSIQLSSDYWMEWSTQLFMLSGIFYVILLQLSKLISCMVDHLVFFYVMNLVVDSCRDETVTNPITNVPSFILARRRLRILVVAETLATPSKMLAGLFVIQTFNVSGSVSYRVPKFLFCTICYALNLLTFIVCGGIQRNDTDNQTQSQTLIALSRSDTPLAPMLPRRQHPSLQKTTSMI
ncbi:hypothetical protein Ddc_09045 [Ditylenchus destructor]|nr:hypothetical protein Ddc_09045 [Ditylenchus destructor]